MDDLGQWKCVLDRLVPSERFTVMLALPELLAAFAPLYDDLVINGKLIKHGFNELVKLRPESFVHAAAWRNYPVIRNYVKEYLANEEELTRMLGVLIRYGDAGGLEAFREALGEVELPLSAELRRDVDLGGSADARKLKVLKERFGYLPAGIGQPQPGVVRDTGLLLPPPVLRLFNNYRPDEMVATLLNPRVEDWLRYEYALALVKQGQPLTEELLRGMERDPKVRALVETARIAARRRA